MHVWVGLGFAELEMGLSGFASGFAWVWKGKGIEGLECVSAGLGCDLTCDSHEVLFLFHLHVPLSHLGF